MNPFISVILLLFAPKTFIRRSTAHAVSTEFETNKQLLEKYPDKELPPEDLKRYEEREGERTQKIRKALFGAFVYTVSAVVIAILSSLLLSAYFGKPTDLIVFAIQILAAAILLIATLALLGWEIQSIGGTTLPEQTNRWLFRAQYWLGTYLLVLSVSWDQSAI